MVSALVCRKTVLIHLGHEVANLRLNVSTLGSAGVVFFWNNYGARRFLIFGAIKGFDWRHMARGAIRELARARPSDAACRRRIGSAACERAMLFPSLKKWAAEAAAPGTERLAFRPCSSACLTEPIRIGRSA